MIRSFLARAFGPHLALFAILVARDWIAPSSDLSPSPGAPPGTWFFTCAVIRLLTVVLGVPLAWAVSLTLVGVRGVPLPSWPAAEGKDETREKPTDGQVALGILFFGASIYVILACIVLLPGWLVGSVNLGAACIGSLWMYLTFRERLGPELQAALEARRREQDERSRREGRRRSLVLQVERDRQEIERLKSSPLGDDAEDEILEVQILLRKHEDELALFDAGGES